MSDGTLSTFSVDTPLCVMITVSAGSLEAARIFMLSWPAWTIAEYLNVSESNGSITVEDVS